MSGPPLQSRLTHTVIDLFCRLDKSVNFGHLGKISICKLSCRLELTSCSLSVSRFVASTVLLYRLLHLEKKGSPAGLYSFSLLTPSISHRDLHTHQLPLSFSHTHSATHSLQDGCLFNPKPLMESAYCLWSTYSRWVNISQLRPLCFFPPWPQPEKVLAGLAKSLSRAWY